MNTYTIYSLIRLICLLIMITFLLANERFNKKKKLEYKNDERWKTVKLSANRIVQKYYLLFTFLVSVGAVYYMMFAENSHTTILLKDVFKILFYIMMLAIPIEYLALRYYDKKI